MTTLESTTSRQPRTLGDVVDGALAAIADRCPTHDVILDQLWRTAKRRSHRAYAACPSMRRFDLAALAPGAMRSAPVGVIVGSGPSAHLVHDPQWSPALEQADVFATNHAAAIAPNPTVCSIELPDLRGRQLGLSDEQGIRFLEWALRRAAEQTPATSLVVRVNRFDDRTLDFVRRFQSLGLPTTVAMQAGLGVRGPDGSGRFARWATTRDAIRWPAPEEPLVCVRGGLGFLVCLCASLGYREIVLFGVDLYSDEYFFDDWQDDERGLGEFQRAMSPSHSARHATATAVNDRPSIVQALASLDRYFLRPRGQKLTVSSERSLLHPALEVARPNPE